MAAGWKGLTAGPQARYALLLVDLNVAAGDEPSIAAGEIRPGYADEKGVLPRTRLGVITGVYSVRVAQFLVHLGIAFESRAVTLKRDRGHAGVRAVHVDAPALRSVVMIRKRCFGFIIHRDKPEIGGETRRLRSDLTAAGDLLCSWRRLAGAGARRDDGARCCHKLVREIRSDKPTCGRIVVPVLRSQRTDLVVVGEGNISEVLWVEGDLEKVSEAAVRSTTKAAR